MKNAFSNINITGKNPFPPSGTLLVPVCDLGGSWPVGLICPYRTREYAEGNEGEDLVLTFVSDQIPTIKCGFRATLVVRKELIPADEQSDWEKFRFGAGGEFLYPLPNEGPLHRLVFLAGTVEMAQAA